MERKELDEIPFASVSTSTDRKPLKKDQRSYEISLTDLLTMNILKHRENTAFDELKSWNRGSEESTYAYTGDSSSTVSPGLTKAVTA